jgi:hypothetical protein
VTEKTKSRTARERKESQDKPMMTNKLSVTAKEDYGFHGRSEKDWVLLVTLSVSGF